MQAAAQWWLSKNFKKFQISLFFNFLIVSWFSQNCPYRFCIISWPIGRPPAERRGVQGGDPPAKEKILLLKYFLKRGKHCRHPIAVMGVVELRAGYNGTHMVTELLIKQTYWNDFEDTRYFAGMQQGSKIRGGR